MHLIDVDGMGIVLFAYTSRHPLLVIPGKTLNLRHNGRCSRTQLAVIGIGIGFDMEVAIGAFDLVFLFLPFCQPRNEQFPDPASTQIAHGIQAAIKKIEVCHKCYAVGRRCPHGKTNALDPLMGHQMRS